MVPVISVWARRGIVPALGIAYAIIQVASLPAVPGLEPDSASYLNFGPIRLAAYPLILQGLGPPLTMLLQPLFYTAAVMALGMYTLKTGQSIFLTVAVMLGLMFNPELNKLHSVIMTESLFMTILLLFLVAVAAFFRRPGWSSALVAALPAGLAATLRPTGYALLPVLVIMALMARRRLPGSFAPVLAAAVLPMLVMVGAERLYATAVHGPDATSLAGRHLFAKGSLMAVPPPDGTEADPVRRHLMAAAEHTFAPIRTLLDQAPDDNILSVLTVNYETCLEYACVGALRAGFGLPEPAMNRAALEVGLQRLAAAPLAYGQLVWRHYRAMLAPYSQSHPHLAPHFNAFIASHQPLPFAALVPTLTAETQSDPKALVLRPAVIAMAGLTGLLALAGLGAAIAGGVSCPLVGTALVAAVTFHGALLWTAAVGVGIPRYMISLWPALMVALAFAGFAFIRRAWTRPAPLLHDPRQP